MIPTDVGPALKRRTAWDVVPYSRVPKLLAKLGMTPGSPDGEEMERKASIRRLALIDELELELVTPLSEFAGAASAASILEYQLGGLPYLDDEEKETLSELLISAAVNVAKSVVANLIDLDLLLVNEDGGLKL